METGLRCAEKCATLHSMHGDKILLGPRDVVLATGLSRTSIWRLESAGDFPRRRQITKQRVAWLASEVVEWARSRPTADSEEAPVAPAVSHPE